MSIIDNYIYATAKHLNAVKNARRPRYEQRIEEAEKHIGQDPGGCEAIINDLKAEITLKKNRMSKPPKAPPAPARTHTAPVTTTSNHQCPHRLPSELKSPSSVQRRISEADGFSPGSIIASRPFLYTNLDQTLIIGQGLDGFSELQIAEAMRVSRMDVNHLVDDSDLTLAQAASIHEARLLDQSRDRRRTVLVQAASRLRAAAVNTEFITYKPELDQAAFKLDQASRIPNLTEELAVNAALIADEQIGKYNTIVGARHASLCSRMSLVLKRDATRFNGEYIEAMERVGLAFSSANLPLVFDVLTESQPSSWDSGAYMLMSRAALKFIALG